MADHSWDRLSVRARDRERERLFAEWVKSEVIPFSGWWAHRLAGLTLEGLDGLRTVPVLEEREAAAAGGPGNPALMLLPTEEQFKRHISRTELFRAARELGRGADRRVVLYRRYKPAHVHEAGVAVLLAVAYTRTDLDRLHLAGARLVEVLGLTTDDALISAVPAGPAVRFWGLYHAALAARITALHPRGVGEEPLTPVRRALALLPATVLAVPSHEALDLLTRMGEEGIRAERLRTVLAVGPPPTASQRTAIAEAALAVTAAEVRVQAVWAPDSARVLWGECRPVSADPAEAGYGLHTYPDLEIVEVRDVLEERMAGEEEDGELIYTSLGWRGTTFIRLATGAWTGGVVTDVPCPACGRTVPRLAPAATDAAWQPRVQLPTGAWARPDLRKAASVLRPSTLSQFGVRDWSLRAVDGTLVLGLDLPEDAAPDSAERIGRAVANAVGVAPEVHVGAKAAAARPQLGNAGPGP